METGLRHRLKRVVRQMSAQHRHLRPIYAELAEALASDAGVREAQERFAHYLEAIDAHFALESEMFFPAVHGLHPDWEAELEALDRDHVVLRETLVEVGQAIGQGAHAVGARSLEGFRTRLREHEAREESLVARLGGVDAHAG